MKKATRLFLILIIMVLAKGNIFPQTGIITGSVTDSKTNEPLIGVNIIVKELSGIGTASNENGYFSIKLPVGSYSLKASLIGYTPVVKSDIIVKTVGEAMVTIQLSESSIELNEISVAADYFDKSIIENNLSTVVLGVEEIKRSPGSMQDFQRILQSMAGVSFSKDKNNELLVRGGSPNENLTVLDNMELHSTNHYPNERSSAGPINMINVDLIDNIQFSTGGFISKYGDKLSSVMNITTREGSRLKPLQANFNISNAGVGAILEGGLNNGNGSWIVSLRKSYIDLIKSAVGLTSVPEYYDVQFKLAYDLSLKHKLICSGIYGNDKIFVEGEAENTNLLLAGKADSVSLFIGNVKQHQLATGISLKSIWRNNLYSLFTIYHNSFHYNTSETEQFTQRRYDSNGEVFQSSAIKNKTLFDNKNTSGELAAKFEFGWNLNKSSELNFGGSLKTIYFNQDIYKSGDSSRYDIQSNGWNTSDDTYVSRPASRINYNFKYFTHQKSYLFVDYKISLFGGMLGANLGFRYDYFSYSKKENLSPRFSASYNLSQYSNINFAYGEYYQTQNYPTYNDRYKSDVNRYLKNTHARHFVLGYENILSDGLKLTVEAYYKKYDDIPVKEEFIHYDERTFRSEKYLNTGKQKTYGIDLLLQQKLVNDFYGTLAFSKMWSKAEDPRLGKGGGNFPSDYEYPNILTIIFGKRFSSLRKKLDEMPFYIKYPSYIFPFSNDMEICARWRFANGSVYTPKVFVTTEQFYEGDSRWSKGSWVSSNDVNSKRYADYHRLDVSFSSRYNFNSWSLSVYLSIENIYNRKNAASYQYNSDGKIETVNQFSIFPVLGIEARF